MAPICWWRKWWRGFNQAEEIALTLSELTGIPCDKLLLRRVRATPQQTKLSAGQRRRNLRGAFQITPHHYRHVALLDDVVTTGATAGQLTLAVCDEQRNKALLVRCVLKRAVLGIHGEIFTLRDLTS